MYPPLMMLATVWLRQPETVNGVCPPADEGAEWDGGAPNPPGLPLGAGGEPPDDGGAPPFPEGW